ncbi:hypothetical protein [Caudoviricetes sp.]|nr:hypothetical protein [Caudoviricetes sp.]
MNMTAGTGLFLLGAYIALAAAYLSPYLNKRNINKARMMTIIASVIGIALTVTQSSIQF